MLKPFLSAVALIAVCFSTAIADAPKKGDVAPEFELKGSDGKSYKLSDFAGKQAVIVAWFPKAFTGGCTKECKSLKEGGDMLRKYNVAYFTASTDTVEKNADFAKSLDLDYPILCDPTGETAKAYGILREPANIANRVTFIIGKDGKVLSVVDSVKTETHAADLAKMLDELGVEKK